MKDDYCPRVQIPPYCDAWMRGDRYGNVIRTTKRFLGEKHPSKHRRDSGPVEIAHVLLDRSNKVVKVVLADCEIVR